MLKKLIQYITQTHHSDCYVKMYTLFTAHNIPQTSKHSPKVKVITMPAIIFKLSLTCLLRKTGYTCSHSKNMMPMNPLYLKKKFPTFYISKKNYRKDFYRYIGQFLPVTRL